MKSEIKRYLGVANVSDPRIDELIDKAIVMIKDTATVKYTSKIFDIITDENGVFCGNLYFKSRNLRDLFKDSDQAVLLGITLGVGVDRLIERTALENIALASVLQSTAAAFIEEEIDKIEPEITFGQPHTMRFSAGYGDFDIAHQADILNMLQAYKIGLATTNSMQLVPTKSVTAIIGIKKEQK